MRRCHRIVFSPFLPLRWRERESLRSPRVIHTIPKSSSSMTRPPLIPSLIFGSRCSAPAAPFLSLRDDYRRDLREVKQATDFQYVRFHAIFHDEVAFMTKTRSGNPVYNFSYVDQIYDGLLPNGVRPFVELSFMPQQAGRDSRCSRLFGTIRSSPRPKIGKWDELITHSQSIWSIAMASTKFRNGISKSGTNRTSISGPAIRRKQPTIDLYDHTARAIKASSPRLRVGGPATAQAAWVDVFITHCADNHVPVDFVSTHVYGNDKAKDVFGTDETISRDQMVCRAVRRFTTRSQRRRCRICR